MKIKRWMWISALVLAALLVGKHFLLDTAAEAKGAYVIDVDALHRAALAGGALPERIEVEKVGEFAFPRNLVVAGEGFHMHPMVLLSHRVLWPDRTLVVDAAMSPEAGKKMPGSKWTVRHTSACRLPSKRRTSSSLPTSTRITLTVLRA